MKALLSISVFIFLFACGEKTGECSTTCFGKSSGQNLGTVTYQNYTKADCEQALQNRETNLTDCTMEWN